jgi:hypothetical protein
MTSFIQEQLDVHLKYASILNDNMGVNVCTVNLCLTQGLQHIFTQAKDSE